MEHGCPTCGSANPAGKKFCGECGASLSEPAAPTPAAPPDLAPAAPAGLAAAAERRQLTVMFCDLVGSTDLSQRLDAEDLRSVVRAYQEAASGAIDRYAGHIAQYLGDGLLVYFGYPQAHEDDAERAVRAGLEILSALRTLNDTLEPQHGIRLAARVGIHTGAVVIGAMGGGAKSEVLALGDTTNIAARLEAVAASDTVVISGATQRLVPGMFLLHDLGTPPLKGIATPIRAHAVLQATGRVARREVVLGSARENRVRRRVVAASACDGQQPMPCPQCQHRNPADAKFCLECGSPSARRCPEQRTSF
jgi:class 3 adenylate cyclase